jgi:type IV pilus assembly protein PilE
MAQRRRTRGFTFVELMIGIVIVGVLTAVALPSFLGQLRKSRRAEAVSTLAMLQQAQERYRSSNTAYAGNGLLTSSLGINGTTASGYYTIAITASSASGYTATATARTGTSQARDDNCQVLAVQMTAGNLGYGASADATINWTDPNRCWAR